MAAINDVHVGAPASNASTLCPRAPNDLRACTKRPTSARVTAGAWPLTGIMSAIAGRPRPVPPARINCPESASRDERGIFGSLLAKSLVRPPPTLMRCCAGDVAE